MIFPHRKQGSAKAVAIGCLAVLLLLGVAVFFVYRGIRGMVDEYTDTKPQAIPQVNTTPAETEAVLARVEGFNKAIQADTPASPLVLTGDDINCLIAGHPDWKALSGKVYITIRDNKIRGDVSVPLDVLGGLTRGRYLNGAGAFSVQLAAGRLMVFIDSMEVKGKPLPNDFIQKMRTENLAKDVNTNADVIAILEKLESISVEDTQLRIMPKKRL